MLGQINTLTRLALRNLFGWNVLRHTKDPRAKRKAILMACVYGFLILVVSAYMGGMAFGLWMLGAGEAVPAYLVAVSSMLIFFLSTFTAGGVLFSRDGYDILCSLPVSQGAIVASRFFRMYVENLALTLVVMVPGLGVWAWLSHPGVGSYLACVLGIFTVPLLPVAAAALFGAVVTGIASRLKHKSLVEAGLSVILILGIFSLTPGLSKAEETFTPEMLAALADTVLAVFGKVYPPAVWLGTAVVRGDAAGALLCGGVSLAGLLAVAAVISLGFHGICRRLFSTSARHDYQMERLKSSALTWSLCRREFRRYFSSGAYVTNTIIGPILGTVLSGTALFVGTEQIGGILPLPVDISGLIPFLVAGIFCLMTPASVSISMEGRNFWIVKTLPLSTKRILDAKLLMNLLLMAPFYLVSEVFLILALKPDFLALLWLVLIPAVIMVFSCVFGIAVNLRLPSLDWDSETAVVKQSASAMLGGIGGFLAALLCLVLTILTPAGYAGLVKLAVCAVLAGVTWVLYTRNNRKDLRAL